jgi:WD40 repeat protein
LNSDGVLVATASEKGTLIRIYRVDTGEHLQELRRGKENAEIYSISFSQNNLYLACTSDRGTIHIFSLDKVNEKIKDLKKKEE